MGTLALQPNESARAVRPSGQRLRAKYASLYPVFGCAIVAFLGSFAFGAKTLNAYFVGDDFGYVARFVAFRWSDWPSLLLHDWSGGIWGGILPELRPVAALSFMIDALFWGANPVGYHLTNLLLHACAATLVGLIARRFAPERVLPAIAATLLFTVHPAHAEPLAWITGRVDSLATCLYLATVYFYLRFRDDASARFLVAATLAFALGLFAKEFVLTAPLMALLLDRTLGRRAAPASVLRLITPYLLWVAIALMYVGCRHSAFGSPSGAGLPRATSIAHHQISYLGYLLSPLDRCLEAGPGLPQRAIAVTAILLSTFVAGSWWAFRRASHESVRLFVAFGLGWYAVAAAPLIVVSYLSARHTYLATGGLCIGLALLLPRTVSKTWAVVLFSLLTVTWSFLLSRELDEFASAGATSRAWRDAVVDAAQAHPRATIVVDADSLFAPQVWLWAWSSPFAFRPPFVAEDLTASHCMLVRPEVHAHSAGWRTATQQLLATSPLEQTCVLIARNERGLPRPRTIQSVAFAKAARDFQDHAAQPDSDAWRQFIFQLTP